jgi:HPr kinase/phosphorylase
MNAPRSASTLFKALEYALALEWQLPPHNGAPQTTLPSSLTPSLIGHLNPIHPTQIQTFGPAEQVFLNQLQPSARETLLQQVIAQAPTLFLITDQLTAPADLAALAQRNNIPIARTPRSSAEVINLAVHVLTRHFAEQTTLHGVFLEVMGLGVLLTGISGIGKSELALELISRGHRLIADDAPEFTRVAPDIISGSCPPALQNFLEVRGLGIVDIRAMFGDSAIKRNKYLHLIVHLERADDRQTFTIDRLHGSRSTRDVLGMHIPQITLPVAPGRNLSVIVEVAVRDHLLRAQGYVADEIFAQRQQKYIDHAADTLHTHEARS